MADHGQTRVTRPVRLQQEFVHRDDVVVTASNRAGMIYRLPGCGATARELAFELDSFDGAEAALFLEDGQAVVRREREEVRFAPVDGRWVVSGAADVAVYPNAFERIWAALHNPNAGEVLVSPPLGAEFADLAGAHHAGGGSHGSLLPGDSEVPVLNVGVSGEPRSITDVAPLLLRHFGVEPPAYAKSLAHAA